MGSRRRRRATSKPFTPSTDSNTTLCLAPDLADPKNWVLRTLTPSEKSIAFGTPRRPGINVDQITPKHPEYCQKVDLVMSSRYHPVSISVFQTKLLKGPNLGAREIRKLGNIKRLDICKKLQKPKQGSNKSGQESDMCPVLCEALNKVLELTGSGFVFKDVSHWSENGDIGHRPDLAMYPTHVQAATAYTLTGKPITKTSVKPARKPHIARCTYQWMITAIEVKPNGVESGFGFKPGEPLLRDGESAIEARAQLATYASEIMLRQHRTHLFLFYIAGSYARIFRWDRNGAVVSHPIDLATDLKQLFNLVYRLALADSVLQGYDSTVSTAEDEEIMKLRNYQPGNEYLESYKALMLDNMAEHPIYKVECDEVLDPDSQRKTRASRRKQFLLGKCVSGGYQPIGRCTKAWVCYCLDDDKMFFMKEQWRANAVGVHPEIETYLRLRKHRVEHVATVVAGGDVVDSAGTQKTVSQRFFDKEGIVMAERIHTRLVIKEVCRPLESYKYSGELIAAVGQALMGHQQAWEKAGVLHRDISVGNIVIDTATVSGFAPGLLIDWDLCKYKEELYSQTGPSQAGISGTWAFGSALSLQYPRKPKELADDLEPFVYIPTYCAFRWHKHRLSSQRIDDLMNTGPEEQEAANRKNKEFSSVKHSFFYAETLHDNGLVSGGASKLDHLESGHPPLTLQAADSPLDLLLSRLYKLLHKHWKTIDMSELKQYQAIPRASPSPQRTPSPGSDEEEDPCVDFFPVAKGTFSQSPTPSTSSGRMSHVSRDSTRTRPLDNHEEILNVFFSVLRDKQGRPLKLGKYLKDKVYDQFNGNLVPKDDQYKNPSSGGTRTATGSDALKTAPEGQAKVSGGKRKPDDSRSGVSRTDHNPRHKRARALKTPNHGMYNPSSVV